MATHDVECLVTVRIDIEDGDPEGVIERVVENVDNWKGTFYPDLDDAGDVLQHLAYNTIANGAESAHRLDGWADLEPDACRMRVYNVEPY